MTHEVTYLGGGFGLNLKGAEKRRVMLRSLSSSHNGAAGCQRTLCRPLTLHSGESSAEAANESEDIANGGLAWADRSEREVEVLVRDTMTRDERKYFESQCGVTTASSPFMCVLTA